MMSSFPLRVKVVGPADPVLVVMACGSPFGERRVTALPSLTAVFFEASSAAVTSDMHGESFEMRAVDDSSSSGGGVPICSL